MGSSNTNMHGVIHCWPPKGMKHVSLAIHKNGGGVIFHWQDGVVVDFRLNQKRDMVYSSDAALQPAENKSWRGPQDCCR